jgi:hypothetical protein
MSNETINITEEINKYIKKIVEKENAEKDYMIAAFIKETGLKISEISLITQRTETGYKIWVEKKRNTLLEDEYNELEEENKELKKEVRHWKANHDNLKEKLRKYTCRPDLTINKLENEKQEMLEQLVDEYIYNYHTKDTARRDKITKLIEKVTGNKIEDLIWKYKKQNVVVR